mmetsp:Transcript_24036/g.36650  ORF Transcript_24036/g.36650 Transcript_24036/m.36650 type:complete len:241 (-) Transcript_24036:95-817(-)
MMIASFLSITFLLSIAVNSSFASDDYATAHITHDMSQTLARLDVECTQKHNDRYLSLVNKDGSYHTKTCGWLDNQNFYKRQNHCRRDYNSVHGLSAAKDGCPVTCERFDFYLQNVNPQHGTFTKRTCLWLYINFSQYHSDCSSDFVLPFPGLKSAKNTCKALCETCSAGPTPTNAPTPCNESRKDKYFVSIKPNGKIVTRKCGWLSRNPGKKLLHCGRTSSHGDFLSASVTCPFTCQVCH